MVQDASLNSALKNARTSIDTVIMDIRARKDFSKTPQLHTTVSTLSELSQSLSNAEVDESLTDPARQSLLAQASEANTQTLTDLIAANIEMANMGQLNTKRTIEPKVALANNANMEKAQQALTQLISLLQATPKPPVPPTPPTPPVKAKLVRLDVSGAESDPSELYYQFYQQGQTVRVVAVTEPDTPEAWAQISWSGGQLPSSKAANQRSLSLGQLTPIGKPHIVTATLAGDSRSVRIAVVPELLRLDVKGAISDGNDTWTLEQKPEKSVVIRAVVEPDTQAAYSYLKWSGGEVDPQNPLDRRLVNTNAFSEPGKPLPVDVEIQLN